VGSGATCLAALKSNRFYAAYEINKQYVDLAERRIREFQERKSLSPLLPPVSSGDASKSLEEAVRPIK